MSIGGDWSNRYSRVFITHTDWLTLIHLLEVPEERKHLILIECWLWYLTRVQQQWKWKYPLEHTITTITTKQTGVPAKIRIDFTTRGRSIIKPSAARRRNFWWNKPLSEFHTSSLSLSQTERLTRFPVNQALSSTWDFSAFSEQFWPYFPILFRVSWISTSTPVLGWLLEIATGFQFIGFSITKNAFDV